MSEPSNELALILQKNNALDTMDDKQFGELAKTSDYIRRVQLFGANATLVKSGAFPMAHWGYVDDKEKPIDLGGEFELIPLSYRPCASSLSGEKVMTVYDMTDPMYEDIKAKSEIKDSGCVFGPEFLIYIPKIEKFALYHMNSITARRESPKMRAQLSKATLLKAKFIKTAKYSWHGPDIYPCSTPLVIPDLAEVERVVQKFLNPPKNEVVAATTTTDRDR